MRKQSTFFLLLLLAPSPFSLLLAPDVTERIRKIAKREGESTFHLLSLLIHSLPPVERYQLAFRCSTVTRRLIFHLQVKRARIDSSRLLEQRKLSTQNKRAR